MQAHPECTRRAMIHTPHTGRSVACRSSCFSTDPARALALTRSTINAGISRTASRRPCPATSRAAGVRTLRDTIALQYGLDYPDEVKGLVLMTVAARPKTRAAGAYEMRLRAAEDPKVYEDWLAYQRHALQFVEPGLREQLMERHRQVGPLSQYHDLQTIDAFDVRDRLATLKPKLLVLRGMDDPTNPPEYEKEIHDAVPGSRYVKLSGAGHFPPTEIPDKVNALIEEFVAAL